ncbi:DUF1330 domain-containing protein [Micromonospora costi]|uniref:DUF1330 domain-containing protein n=1 Tax=Micromonospora costi TaxID=1530042 RepID=A0A3A9ZV09_9ACTN|nr:DUF1330 domain-containing protein [Micromonospora costi]RKN52043.1 DUF1330 domain-containing protein [Micromonospora costi]
MTTDAGVVRLCCLLWAHPGRADALHAYEDRVLPWIAEHGGEVVHRALADGTDGHPHEVQLFRFPDRAALDAYLRDPRRTALSAERDAAVARTDLFPVRF